MNAQAFLQAKAERTEAALTDALSRWPDVPSDLMEAIRYSLFAGGKRLRPALALGASELVGGDDAPAVPAACALEMLHTYSLIHDDLPSMDDDDFRRGKPSLHKAHGEAAAVLAGDALQAMAFELLAETGNGQVAAEVARAVGPEGMVGGQLLDLDAEGEQVKLDALRDLHQRKTGALIRVSVRAGALLAGAKTVDLDSLTRYGEHLGLAFQIADDLLDVTGDAEAMGKSPGSDEAHEKSTYPALLGVDETRRLGDETVAQAIDALADFGPEADALRAVAQYVMERDR